MTDYTRNTIARILSVLFCGIGHWVFKYWFKGMVLSLWFLFSLAGALYFLFIATGEVEYIFGVVFSGLFLAAWVYSQMDLHEIITDKQTADVRAAEERMKQKEKERKLATLLREDLEEKKHGMRTEGVSEKKLQADEYYRQGRLLLLRDDREGARDFFEMTLEVNSKDGDAMFQLAKVYYELGDAKRAQDLFLNYLDLKGQENRKWNSESKSYLKKISELKKKKQEARG